jgi:hypothetical protein|tara:strand:+ start:84 stop:308 length:225 start_codon:yes stop_codon:yes gene_type:complete
MHKIQQGDTVYWFMDEEVFNMSLAHRGFLLFADVAINISKNEVIKCRYDLQEVFDRFIGLDRNPVPTTSLKETL